MSITYTDARNPKWANVGQTIIEIEVNFDHLNKNMFPLPLTHWTLRLTVLRFITVQ